MKTNEHLNVLSLRKVSNPFLAAAWDKKEMQNVLGAVNFIAT